MAETAEFVGQVLGDFQLASGVRAEIETYVHAREPFSNKPMVVGWRGVMRGLPLAILSVEVLERQLTFVAETGESFQFRVTQWLAVDDFVEIVGLGAWPGKGDPFSEDD